MQRFRIGAVIDDLWQTVQPGPGGEQQAQWTRLQFCQVTVGDTEWIECSRPNHLLSTIARWSTDPRVSLRPHEGHNKKKNKKKKKKMMMMMMMMVMTGIVNAAMIVALLWAPIVTTRVMQWE